MKVIIIFTLMFGLVNCCQAQKLSIDTNNVLFDKADLTILLNAKQVKFYKLEGEPIDDSLKVSKYHYIKNYLIKSVQTFDKPSVYDLLSSLINCSNLITDDKNRCTLLSSYCIEFRMKRIKLLLLFSEPHVCGEGVEVNKINTLNNRQIYKWYKLDSISFLKGT